MAEITAITYGRTFNNGDYESTRIDVTCDVRPGEDPNEVFDEIIEHVTRFRVAERRQERKNRR